MRENEAGWKNNVVGLDGKPQARFRSYESPTVKLERISEVVRGSAGSIRDFGSEPTKPSAPSPGSAPR